MFKFQFDKWVVEEVSESAHFSACFCYSVVDVKVFGEVEGYVCPEVLEVGSEVDVRCAIGYRTFEWFSVALRHAIKSNLQESEYRA